PTLLPILPTPTTIRNRCRPRQSPRPHPHTTPTGQSMSLKPYCEYKDSNIQWLSTVPSHWEVNKIGRISQFTVGWTPPTGIQENFEGDNRWANISDLGPRIIYDTAKRVSDNAVEASRLKPSPRGSLLFGFKLSVGDVSFAGTEMYTNEAIATFFESVHVTLRYAYYAYPIFIVENASENIYNARILNQERIRNAKIAFPHTEEQREIADFLDRETAEIDAFIVDQERLIELLEERRTATITQVLEKTSNETDHIRLRYVAEINPSIPASVRKSTGLDVTFLAMESIYELGGFDRSKTRPIEEVNSGYSYFEDNDVIYAK